MNFIRAFAFYEKSRSCIHILRVESLLIVFHERSRLNFQCLKRYTRCSKYFSYHFAKRYKQNDFMAAAASRFVSTINFMFLFQSEIRTHDPCSLLEGETKEPSPEKICKNKLHVILKQDHNTPVGKKQGNMFWIVAYSLSLSIQTQIWTKCFRELESYRTKQLYEMKIF